MRTKSYYIRKGYFFLQLGGKYYKKGSSIIRRGITPENQEARDNYYEKGNKCFSISDKYYRKARSIKEED